MRFANGKKSVENTKTDNMLKSFLAEYAHVRHATPVHSEVREGFLT